MALLKAPNLVNGIITNTWEWVCKLGELSHRLVKQQPDSCTLRIIPYKQQVPTP